MTWPHPLTHPTTHQPIHPPIGGGVSRDFKSSNRFKISWFIQVLLNFYWFGWSPMGGGGWGLNGGLGMMWGWQGWCGDNRDIMGKTWGWRGRWGRHHYHDKHVGSHLQFFVCVCVCACMCICVHMCGDTPPRSPTTHLPPPQSCREPKTSKFNKSWTNWENSPIRGWGGLSKMSKKVQNVHNWIISIRSKFIWF